MIDTAKVKITIDKEFCALIPAMAAHEREQLEKNLLAERGARDPIIVWDFNEKQILLDGHNRYELCRKHGLGYPIKRKKFFDRNAARNWVIENQLGRRNITDEQRRYLLGKLHIDTAAPAGRPSARASAENTATVAVLAEQHGVSERTVHNAVDFAETVDAIGEKSPELKQAILAGEVQASTADLEAIAEAPKRKVESVAKKVLAGDKRAVKEAVKDEPEPDAEPAGGYEPVEAKKHLDKLADLIGKAAREHAAAVKILGPSQAMGTVFSGLDTASIALTKFRAAFKRKVK